MCHRAGRLATLLMLDVARIAQSQRNTSMRAPTLMVMIMIFDILYQIVLRTPKCVVATMKSN